MRRELLIVVAFLLLGGAVVATTRHEGMGRVVGARHALHAGVRLTFGDVMAVERPAAFASTRTIRLDEVSSVIGSTLLRDVEAGTPLLLDDVGSAQPGGAGVSRPRLGVRPSPGVRGGRRGARMKGLSRELRCV